MIGFVGADGEGLGGIEHALDDDAAAGTAWPGDLRARRRRRARSRRRRRPAPTRSTGRRATHHRPRHPVGRAGGASPRRSQSSGADAALSSWPWTPAPARSSRWPTAPTFDPNDASLYEAGRAAGNRALSGRLRARLHRQGHDRGRRARGGRRDADHASSPSRSFRSAPTGPSRTRAHPAPCTYTLAGTVAKSSNIGTHPRGRAVGADTLHPYLVKFGIGQPTGLGFPGESRGVLPSPRDLVGDRSSTRSPSGRATRSTRCRWPRSTRRSPTTGSASTPPLTLGTVGPDGTCTRPRHRPRHPGRERARPRARCGR